VRYEFRQVERLRGMKCFPGGEVVLAWRFPSKYPINCVIKKLWHLQNNSRLLPSRTLSQTL